MAENCMSTLFACLPCSFVTILVFLQIQPHFIIGYPQSHNGFSMPQDHTLPPGMMPFFGGNHPEYYGNWTNPFSSPFPYPFQNNFKKKRGPPNAHNKERNSASKTIETLETIIESELECENVMFFGPFHDPIMFSQDTSIYTRIDKSCSWSLIGTEPCIPTISCDTSHLILECDHEYLEIVDGATGYMKICGGNVQQVTNVSASGNLRDLFVQFKVLKGDYDHKAVTPLFSCTVACSERNQGTQLETVFKPKINPKCFCGTKPNEDRIVGGNAVKKFEYPWLVALVETNSRQPFCGGSIINNRMIATAAHCIKGKFMDYQNIQVLVHGHELDTSPVGFQESRTYSLQELESMDKKNGSRRYNIDEIIIHELYMPDTNDFDIALLKLQDDIDFITTAADAIRHGLEDYSVPQAKPVCLPELGSYLRTYSNRMAIVAGWGLQGMDAERSSQILQNLEVKVYSSKACKDTYNHRVNRRMICAGHKDGGRDACSGDSGGALIVEEKPHVWTQIGTVSWGEGCGLVGNPGVYFRITEGLQWIHYKSNYNGWRDEEEDRRDITWCVTPPMNDRKKPNNLINSLFHLGS